MKSKLAIASAYASSAAAGMLVFSNAPAAVWALIAALWAFTCYSDLKRHKGSRHE